MSRLMLALALAAPLLSGGCVTFRASQAFESRRTASLPPSAKNTAQSAREDPPQRSPVALKQAVRTWDGVYHVLVDYGGGIERHFSYDPGHPALAEGAWQAWASASHFHHPEEGPTPTMTPQSGGLPPGVPLTVGPLNDLDGPRPADGSGEGGGADSGPVLRLTYAVIYLREGGEHERLAMIPTLPRTTRFRRSVVYRQRSVASGRLAKAVIYPLTVLIDAALLPISLTAYAVER